jgi:hypothetical protein
MALDLKPFEVLAGGVAASFLASAAAMSTTQTVLAGIGGAVADAKSAFKVTADIGLQVSSGVGRPLRMSLRRTKSCSSSQ